MDLDRKLLISLAAVLVGFGILMVHSASITSRPSEAEQVFLSRHLTFVAFGAVAAAVATCLPAGIWQRAAPYFFWTTVGLLALVLVPGFGSRINGAQRWFRSGAVSFQPAEFVKLSLPLYVACLIQRRRDVLSSWVSGTIPVVFPILIAVPLVMLQPDLGTALFLAAGGATVLWVGGWPLRNFLLAAGTALPVVGLTVWHKPYQMQRIADFLATWSDWTQAPYHLKQSLVTLGAGGIWGVGLGRGFQKLSFLPEANSDFVFAVIGEELGLVGSLSVMALWLGLYVVGLRLANRLPADTFRYQVAFTLLTQLILQATLNIAVVTAMVPPKGIPHPMISYGGSNLVVSLIALGIVLSLTRDEGAIFPYQPALTENCE
ncbi:MAG: cell division protein FtsW [Planctomycetaceae bacterium]|nr:cell division protein FtsW [Planctomycetaceae bacterium]